MDFESMNSSRPVQQLGVSHKWSSAVWLCGPISGLVVQPIVGYYSDRCKSRFGRRRPFIVAGVALVAIAVFLIGYAADIDVACGDTLDKLTKPRAVAVFVVWFWILDVANNMLQGPCRALLADMSGSDNKKMSTAMAWFSFFMAVGNVLGYAAGSLKGLHKMFPFTVTKACDIYCANLKSCFFIAIALLALFTVLAMVFVREDTIEDHREEEKASEGGGVAFLREIKGAFKELKKPMWILLLVTCLNWIAWFGFLLFDTDWMGKEVYGGEVGKGHLYDMGVRAGSLGLMLNSIVLGLMSLGIVYLVGRDGANLLWGVVNFLLAICLLMAILVTKLIGSEASTCIAAAPCSDSGGGQGLSLGVLNVAIALPQMFVSLVSGPLDAAFGGGNLPAFVLGAVAAVISGILALTYLPSPQPDDRTTENNVLDVVV
ncbi:hypothetical protein ACLB2K_074541 [Fragaria x ananassa]